MDKWEEMDTVAEKEVKMTTSINDRGEVWARVIQGLENTSKNFKPGTPGKKTPEKPKDKRVLIHTHIHDVHMFIQLKSGAMGFSQLLNTPKHYFLWDTICESQANKQENLFNLLNH